MVQSTSKRMRGRGSNLTKADRRRGGLRSAQSQKRNKLGRFSGAGSSAASNRRAR